MRLLDGMYRNVAKTFSAIAAFLLLVLFTSMSAQYIGEEIGGKILTKNEVDFTFIMDKKNLDISPQYKKMVKELKKHDVIRSMRAKIRTADDESKKVLNAQYDVLISYSEEALKRASEEGQLAVLNKELFSAFTNAYMKYSKFSDYIEAETNYGTTVWIGVSNKLSNMQRVKALDALQVFASFAVKQVSIELG